MVSIQYKPWILWVFSKFVFRAKVCAYFISFRDVPSRAGGCLLLVHLSFKSNERHRLAGSD